MMASKTTPDIPDVLSALYKKELISHQMQEECIKEGKAINPNFVDSKKICGKMRMQIERETTPEEFQFKNVLHRPQPVALSRVSDLVIRKEKGGYVLAAFISRYTSVEIRRNTCTEPDEWLFMDLVTGRLLRRESKLHFDGDNREYDNSLPEGVYDCSSAFYRSTYTLLDEVRIGIMRGERLDRAKYGKYMRNIKANVPDSVKAFYDDISNINAGKERRF